MNSSSAKNAMVGLIVGVLLVAITYGGYVYLNPEPEWMHDIVSDQPVAEGFHIHADFALYINGTQFDFAKPQYMTSTDVCHVANSEKHLHLHDMNGSVAHAHEADHTWGDFFDALNFKLADGSLTTDTGTVYRNEGQKQWHYLVNGLPVASIVNYKLQDLDRILLSYGAVDSTILNTQMNRVTHQSCIYSKKCPVPEGIVLPPENCSSDIIVNN